MTALFESFCDMVDGVVESMGGWVAFPKSKLTIMKYALASKKPIEPGVDDFLKYFTFDHSLKMIVEHSAWAASR